MIRSSVNPKSIWLVVSAVILSALGGLGVAYTSGSLQYFMFFFLLVSLVLAFIMTKNPFLSGFALWIWFFILGYRAVHVTSNFSLHPLIVLLVLLSLFLLIYSKSASAGRLRLPLLLWVFSFFWLWGFVPGLLNGVPLDKMLSEALNFFFILPLFLVMLFLSRYPQFWRRAALTFLGSGIVIALFGALEYFVPPFRALLAGFAPSEEAGIVSQSGFIRASFTFFGANPAVLISALAVPMVGVIPVYFKPRAARFMSLAALAILGVGIYISGSRAAWLMLLISSILMAYFYLKIPGVGAVALFWVLASRFLPASAWNLLLSISTPLASGQFLDTSMEKRFVRQQTALDLAWQNPLGLGWTGAGWVHGDFAQVAANLGILAALVFLAWYLFTLYRALKVYRNNPHDRLFQALLTGFVLAGFVLATEGVQVLPQYAMPVWFVWGLMECYLQRRAVDKPAARGGELD